MKIRDMFTKEFYDKYGDIDIYNDVTDGYAPAFCGGLLTSEGEEYYKEALELEVEINEGTCYGHPYYSAIIKVDDPDENVWKKRWRAAWKLFTDHCGYIPDEDYNRRFKMIEEEDMALMDREVALAHYMQSEFGLIWDYTVPPAHRISVAYTTVTDEERDAQVEVDIYEMKVYYYLDGEPVLEEQWSEETWIENFEWSGIFGALIDEIEKIANNRLEVISSYLEHIQALTEEEGGMITVHPLGDNPFTVTEKELYEIACQALNEWAERN